MSRGGAIGRLLGDFWAMMPWATEVRDAVIDLCSRMSRSAHPTVAGAGKLPLRSPATPDVWSEVWLESRRSGLSNGHLEMLDSAEPLAWDAVDAIMGLAEFGSRGAGGHAYRITRAERRISDMRLLTDSPSGGASVTLAAGHDFRQDGDRLVVRHLGDTSPLHGLAPCATTTEPDGTVVEHIRLFGLIRQSMPEVSGGLDGRLCRDKTLYDLMALVGGVWGDDVVSEDATVLWAGMEGGRPTVHTDAETLRGSAEPTVARGETVLRGQTVFGPLPVHLASSGIPDDARVRVMTAAGPLLAPCAELAAVERDGLRLLPLEGDAYALERYAEACLARAGEPFVAVPATVNPARFVFDTLCGGRAVAIGLPPGIDHATFLKGSRPLLDAGVGCLTYTRETR